MKSFDPRVVGNLRRLWARRQKSIAPAVGTHSEAHFVAEFLEARAYLSAVTFPTTPAEYALGGTIETGGGVDSNVAVADFNGDGSPDVAVAINSLDNVDGSVSVLLNKGNGTFGPMISLPAGHVPFQVIAGIFTSSGHEDLVVTNGQDGTVDFYAGQGNGTFAAPIVSTYGTHTDNESDVANLAAADLNGDGKLDLIVSDEDDHDLVTMLGNGAGSFTVAQTIPADALGGEYNSIVIGNFLNDGHVDVATCPDNDAIIDVFAGNGDGTLSTTPVQLSTGTSPFENTLPGLVTGDFTGNGRDDLALVTQSLNVDAAAISVFLNQGNGSFSAPVNTSLPNEAALAVADFNGDGKLDAVVSDGIYLGNGDGTFQPTPAYNLTNLGFNAGPTVADLNGDGMPDILETTTGNLQQFPSGSVLAVYLNGQSGTSPTPTPTPTPTGTATLTPVLSGKLPSSVIAGQKATIAETVTITNTSGAAYDGSTTGNLFLSTGTTVDSDSIELPGSLTKTLKLKSGAKFSFKFSLKSLPSSVPDGTYHLLARATDKNGNSNVAASSGTITVAPPQINLALTLPKFATTEKGGKKFTESLAIANSGNIPAAGSVPIVVYTSPDGLLSDATQLGSITKKINVKNGHSSVIPLSLTAPASGTSAFLIIAIDPNRTLGEITPANDTIVSSSAVTFS